MIPESCCSTWAQNFPPFKQDIFSQKMEGLHVCTTTFHASIWVYPKKWYPQIIHFNRGFHYKPSILGVPLFLETSIYLVLFFSRLVWKPDIVGSHHTVGKRPPPRETSPEAMVTTMTPTASLLKQ